MNEATLDLRAAVAAVLEAAHAIERHNYLRSLLEARFFAAIYDLHQAADPRFFNDTQAGV